MGKRKCGLGEGKEEGEGEEGKSKRSPALSFMSTCTKASGKEEAVLSAAPSILIYRCTKCTVIYLANSLSVGI